MCEFLPYSTSELLELFKTEYYKETGKQLIIGSDEFAFSSVAAYVLRVLEQEYNKKIKDFSIDTATGEALDTIGAVYGVKRYGATPSRLFAMVSSLNTSPAPLSVGQVTVTKNGFTFTNTQPYNITQLYVYVTLVCTQDGVESNGTQCLDSDIIINNNTSGLVLTFDGDGDTARGGNAGCLDYSPESDSAFREYIKQHINFTIGTQKAYEVKALENRYLDDAYVLRDEDSGFEAGKVKLYYYYQGMTNYNTQLENELLEALTADDFKCVCDAVSVHAAVDTPKTLDSYGFYITYPESYQMPDDSTPSKSVAQVHYEETLAKYAAYLSAKLGRFPYTSEIIKRLCTPDSKGRSAHSALIQTSFSGFNPPNGVLKLSYPSWSSMVNASHISYTTQGEL